MPEDNKLKIIDGGGKNIIRPKRRSLSEPQMIVCYRCNGASLIELRLGAFRKPSGKLVGGTKIYACAVCYKRDGEIVELAKA